MHHSKYAAKLVCQHCSQNNRSEDWPVNGDRTPLYYQTEPGHYQVKVRCPHCTKDWYVVWDQDPGSMRRLDSADEPLGSGDVYVKNKFELSTRNKSIPTGTLGIVKKNYPGGMVIVTFPSLDVEDSWTDDVFTKVSQVEAARLKKENTHVQPSPKVESRKAESQKLKAKEKWWKFWK